MTNHPNRSKKVERQATYTVEKNGRITDYVVRIGKSVLYFCRGVSQTEQEAHDIARRIVACVNACEGYQTFELEANIKAAGGFAKVVNQLNRELMEAKQQRDELLAALEQMLFGANEEHPFVIRARAAIAKVRGG